MNTEEYKEIQEIIKKTISHTTNCALVHWRDSREYCTCQVSKVLEKLKKFDPNQLAKKNK